MSILNRVVNDIKATPGVLARDLGSNAPLGPVNVAGNGLTLQSMPGVAIAAPVRGAAPLPPAVTAALMNHAQTVAPNLHAPSYLAGLHDGAAAHQGLTLNGSVNQAPGFETYDPSGGPQQFQTAQGGQQGSAPNIQGNLPLYGSPAVQ